MNCNVPKAEFFQGLVDELGQENSEYLAAVIQEAKPGKDRVMACSHVAADRSKGAAHDATNNLVGTVGGTPYYFMQLIVICAECLELVNQGTDIESLPLEELQPIN